MIDRISCWAKAIASILWAISGSRSAGQRTGVPVLVNTSFNSRGEPVVCTPRDALESFWSTPLDALVIGPFLIEKPR